jgi:hypothetical protein
LKFSNKNGIIKKEDSAVFIFGLFVVGVFFAWYLFIYAKGAPRPGAARYNQKMLWIGAVLSLLVAVASGFASGATFTTIFFLLVAIISALSAVVDRYRQNGQ